MLRYPSPIPVPKSNPQSKESRVLTNPVTGDEFSAEEIQLFRKRFENGYNLEHDARYNEWKKKVAMQHDSLEQSSDESTYEDWMFTRTTAEKTPDTLTQPRCTLKKTTLGNDVIDSWHRGTFKKSAITSSGAIRLHGPQSDWCPGPRQPVGVESDMYNSSVTHSLPSSPSPHQPHSVDLKNTSSTVPIVKQLPNTATNNDIIKPRSIRTLNKTATSTNDSTQPKLTLRHNATNDDTHKKTAAIDDITQPRRRTVTDSLKKTAAIDDITHPRCALRTATDSLKKTAANDDITQPKCTLKPVTSLKKTATNNDITQPRRTFRKTASQPRHNFKKTATNNDDF
uniref:Uncharacterized protein n=1 Tax=Amphimedon queenslandica TaxID=400682 RepID=A0A1X7UE98_AMPQE